MGDEVAEIVEGTQRLHDAGARDVVVSRAKGGALALLDGVVLEARAPEMTALEPSGAGDAVTAAIAYGRSRGSRPANCCGSASQPRPSHGWPRTSTSRT